MKKIIGIVLAVILCLGAVGCSNSQSNKDKFVKYIKENYESNDNIGRVVLPSGYKLTSGLFSIEKEKDSYLPKVVIGYDIFPSDDNFYLQGFDKIKEDMKFIGDMAISYADSQNWDNDYYLYVQIYIPWTADNLVYDYELEALYAPEDYSKRINLYKEFGSFYVDDVAEMDGGMEYLIENRFGVIKHGKFEKLRSVFDLGPNVFIDDDGKFQSRELKYKYQH